MNIEEQIVNNAPWYVTVIFFVMSAAVSAVVKLISENKKKNETSLEELKKELRARVDKSETKVEELNKEIQNMQRDYLREQKEHIRELTGVIQANTEALIKVQEILRK
jgi:peptidoglycan hydrolase CwlO-like protein